MRSGQNTVALAVWICISVAMVACGSRHPTTQTTPARWRTTGYRLTIAGTTTPTDSVRECFRLGWQWAQCP